MKHIIIGTAGHIDHGKTTLVKALTGRDTDRLAEEKKRGISIDLGFAFFDLPDGSRAGVVDVPGHERFLKNMIAGASGIDAALLVVDATEGVKPQTLEHAAIVDFLGISEGIIVLTKWDAADEIMRELAAEDVREKLKGTMFAEKEIVGVDSVSGFGLEILKERIAALASSAAARNASGPPRMHIDRVFTIRGHGVVVTGALAEGTIKTDDELLVYTHRAGAPLKVKIKRVQVHDSEVRAAQAGQRTALNLSGVKAQQLARGDTLAAENILIETSVADAQINLLNRGGIKIKNWERLRVHHGAREIFARAAPFTECGEISAGEAAFCQLRFEKPAHIKKGDRIIIRRYSPAETIGGGVVADPSPVKRRKADRESIENLLSRLKGTDAEIVGQCLRDEKKPVTHKQLAKISALVEARVQAALEALVETKTVYKIGDSYLHSDVYIGFKEKISMFVSGFHEKNPLLAGVPKSALRSKVSLPLSQSEFENLLETTEREREISIAGNAVSIFGFVPRYTEAQMKIKTKIEGAYIEAGFAPPSASSLVTDKATKEVFDALAGVELINLGMDTFIHIDYLNKAAELVRKACEENSSVNLAELRDLTGSSRKYCLMILEYLDDKRITVRDGDVRRLR